MSLKRVNVMLDEKDLALLDAHFPSQRSVLLRAMIRKFIEKNIKPRAPRKETEPEE